MSVRCGRAGSMLIDTDVLIWVFRGNLRAAKLVESIPERRISIVTYLELIQGARDRDELRHIKSFLTAFGLEVQPLSENIGHRASIYIEEHGRGIAMRLPDALIAATAVEHGLTLCTGNRRHYQAVRELAIKAFRP
jgi:predicted nucleic acid-binding protein